MHTDPSPQRVTNAQSRRLGLGIIFAVLGLIVGNIGIQTAFAQETRSNAALGGVLAGVVLLAAGAYLLARYFVLRKRG